jgi:23S rRNA (cytosine1962-C5)-methyltransferase
MKPRRPARPASRSAAAPLRGLPSLPLDLEPATALPAAYLDRPTTHPNVYRKRIRELSGAPRRGDWLAVYHLQETEGHSGPVLLGYGLYNSKSEIAIRIVRWHQELPGAEFWDQQLERAIALRRDVLQLHDHTDCYRVIHAEADGFPGLMIDRYGDVLSAEVFSWAMGARAGEILRRLGAKLGTQHTLIQPSPQLASQEGAEFAPLASAGLPGHVTVTEHGTRFRVHFGTGHKTGFFCDQRENRFQLAEFCRGRSVLDVCCYTGGFAVQAARLGGASEVTGIDLDEEPLKFARQNAALNDVRIRFTQADAFAYMRDMLRAGKTYDVVVLDPPKLIRSRTEIEEGTKKHFDLNRLAMQLVKPGGVMLTCTCAGLLPEEEFVRLVRAAARSSTRSAEHPDAAPRPMQILRRSGAAACHPVSAHFPEGEYLKAMWLRLN